MKFDFTLPLLPILDISKYLNPNIDINFEIINSIILSKFDGICQIESNPQDKINGKDNFTKAFMIFDSSQAKITQFVEGNEEGYFNDFTDILFLNKGGKINPNKRK